MNPSTCKRCGGTGRVVDYTRELGEGCTVPCDHRTQVDTSGLEVSEEEQRMLRAEAERDGWQNFAKDVLGEEADHLSPMRARQLLTQVTITANEERRARLEAELLRARETALEEAAQAIAPLTSAFDRTTTYGVGGITAVEHAVRAVRALKGTP